MALSLHRKNLGLSKNLRFPGLFFCCLKWFGFCRKFFCCLKAKIETQRKFLLCLNKAQLRKLGQPYNVRYSKVRHPELFRQVHLTQFRLINLGINNFFRLTMLVVAKNVGHGFCITTIIIIIRKSQHRLILLVLPKCSKLGATNFPGIRIIII